MAVKSPSPSGYVRKHDGGWFDRMLPYLAGFQATQLGERNVFVARVAEETGLAVNTTRRALGMLSFLSEQGVDLATMRARPAILAIEAVSKVHRLNVALGADLLKKLLAGEGTVLSFRAEADRIAAKLNRVETSSGERVRLSDVAVANLPKIAGFVNAQFFDRPLMPAMVVDVDGFRLAIFAIVAQSPTTRLANAPLLIEGTVLRSVVTCSRTVVCSEIALDELAKTARSMRPEFADRLEIKPASIENDLSTEDQRTLFRQRVRENLRYRDSGNTGR